MRSLVSVRPFPLAGYRKAFACTHGSIVQDFSSPGPLGAMRARVISWDSGDTDEMGASVNGSRPCFLAEGPEIEWEGRVDLANGSKPATKLFAEPIGAELKVKRLVGPSCRKLSAITPWEKREFWVGGRICNVLANTAGKLHGNLKRKKIR